MRVFCLAVLLFLVALAAGETKKAKPSTGSQVVDDVVDKAVDAMGDIIEAVADTLGLDDVEDGVVEEENEEVTSKKPPVKPEASSKPSGTTQDSSGGAKGGASKTQSSSNKTKSVGMDNALPNLLGSLFSMPPESMNSIIQTLIKLAFDFLKDADPEFLINIYNFFRNAYLTQKGAGSQ